MKRRLIDTQTAIEELRQAASQVNHDLTFMEVCGTHTMSAFRSGLRSVIPANVKLLSGPGCPVCVTAQGDIDQLIELAFDPTVTMCTYGDMLRVPGRRGSLEKARSLGADVRVVYSTMDAVNLAKENGDRQVVFGAVGFETTAPATAAAVKAAQAQGIENFTVLASHKLVIPAMKALLDAGQVNVDGFLCPGHVSVVIGSQPYREIVDHYAMPCVIAGFEALGMLAALGRLVEQARDHRAELVNQYPEAVSPRGNEIARKLLDEVFEPADVRWRGLARIDHSGLVLRDRYRRFDAARRFGLGQAEDYEIPGCVCGQVITGLVNPDQCKLFGKLCTPIHPVGPCMVSSEGTCQAWFKYNRAGAAKKVTEVCG